MGGTFIFFSFGLKITCATYPMISISLTDKSSAHSSDYPGINSCPIKILYSIQCGFFSVN